MASNVEAANNMAMQGVFDQNQERYVTLSDIIDEAVQRTYHQLMLMIDMLPAESNDQNKMIKIVAFACRTRQLFMRIYALVKFIRTAHINVSNILSFLDQQSFMFVDTADFLYHLARVKLVNARLPSFSILTAVDVLTLGTYPRLPSCVKDRILPPEKITNEEKERTLETLNRIIQCRLALSELPQQLKNFKIENGCVKFTVRNEFEVKLTLINDNFKMPWRLLKLNVLVKDAQDPNRQLVHKMQTNFLHEVVQMRLNENDRPLVDLYKSIHFFTQSLQLEILFDQMNSLNLLTMNRFYKITEYLSWRKLTVRYWLEHSKNQYEYKFTVFVAENSDYLQTTHHPPLHWRDHKNIDLIFKSDELLIERLVHQIIKFRSKKRLIEIQSIFDNISYCKATLVEEKPALKVEFHISKFQNETLWISIDYYTGLVQVFFPHSSLNATLKNSIESALNSDLKKFEQYLLNLRMWLLLKRCETLIKTYGFKCYDDLYIVSFADATLSNLYSKLEKNRLFIELKKQEKIIIMVTIRSKDELSANKDEIDWYENQELLENENSLCFNYYILHIAKCKYDGELHPSKPFLKLMSLSHFKRNSIFNTEHVLSKMNSQRNRISKNLQLEYRNTADGGEQVHTNGHSAHHTDNWIVEFINMVFYIEERLPYLTLMSILNKQNVVTQNINTNPSMIEILSLNLMSVPPISNADQADYASVDKLSRELSSLVISFTIRQRQFKDYTNTVIPITSNLFPVLSKLPVFGMFSRFLFTIEFTLNNDALFVDTAEPFTFDETHHQRLQIFNTTLEANSLEAFYESIRLEWISMCRMYNLIKELKAAFRAKPHELGKQLKVKTVTLKKLVLKYGVNFAYTIQFQWSKEAKAYDISLGVDGVNTARAQVDAPLTNYHQLFMNEIKKHFAANQSVVNLIQLLNYTCVSTFALAKLSNLPKFYSKVPNLPLLSCSGFMVIICSLTHFRLVYYSKYCLDIHIKPNGLVSIRDGSFGLTDINAAIDELYPIQLLSTFLNLFLDENVQELLRRRASLVEDDNPDSPSNNFNSAVVQQHHQTQQQSQYNQSHHMNQQQSHVFLPPTSPAVQPRTNMNIPTPSPCFVQSPGISAPTSNAPSIAQSPGFTNFGSPAIPHSSPSTGASQQIITTQPQSGSQMQQSQHGQQQAQMGHSTSIQSPSGFMSPATGSQQPNYATQSPANFSELSLQSPIQSISIKSPFVGPSPSTNVPSVQQASNYGMYKDTSDDPAAKMSSSRNQQLANVSSGLGNLSTSSLLFNYHQYKKCHSASIPIYLSEAGFLKMLTINTDNNYCPLEIFLASYHLKKLLLKAFQSDLNTFQLKNSEANIYKTYLLEFQISNEISSNYNAFSLTFMQINGELPVDKIQTYFNAKILTPPYKFSNAISYFNMISTHEPKLLKEFIQLLDFEMNPAAYRFPWRVKFSWTVPNGYVLKPNAKPQFTQFYNSMLGFQRKDRYYFIMYLFNQQRAQNVNQMFNNQNSLAYLLLMISYESSTNNFQFEILKPTLDNSPIYGMYDNLLNNLITSYKQRDINNSMLSAINEILMNLPVNLQPR